MIRVYLFAVATTAASGVAFTAAMYTPYAYIWWKLAFRIRSRGGGAATEVGRVRVALCKVHHVLRRTA